MTKQNVQGRVDVKLTVQLLRIVFAVALIVSVPLFAVSHPYSLLLYLIGGLVAGGDLLIEGVKNFLREDYFTANTVLVVVFIVSYIIGVGYEGSLLLILSQAGTVLSDYVRKVVRNHIIDMTGLNFKTAKVFRGGLIVENFLKDIHSGDEIMVAAGEYFPVDCVIIEGNTTVRPQLLDSKQEEYAVNIGDTVFAGTMNLGVDVRCEVISEGASTATDILEVLKNSEKIDKPIYAKYFQPFMTVFAVLIGFMLVLFTDVDAYDAVHRSLAVLTLSAALPAYAGVGDIRFAARAGAASRGAVFASDDIFNHLGACETAVICADGIMTDGKLRVTAAYSDEYDEDTFMCIAAHAMAHSSDPAAEAILNAYNGDIVFEWIEDFREIPNCGVMIVYRGTPVVLGTQALMSSVKGLLPKKMNADRQMMFMLVGKKYAGYIVLTDPISELAEMVSEQLQSFGVQNVEFVTSYSADTAQKISEISGVEQFSAGITCDERLQYVEQVSNRTAGKLAYIYSAKYGGDVHSAADYDVSIGCNTKAMRDGKADVICVNGRSEAVFEGLYAAQCAKQMSESATWCIMLVKLLLIVFAGAGLATIWFVAAFELIATLFVKVYAAGAFDEATLFRFGKKNNTKNKEKA